MTQPIAVADREVPRDLEPTDTLNELRDELIQQVTAAGHDPLAGTMHVRLEEPDALTALNQVRVIAEWTPNPVRPKPEPEQTATRATVYVVAAGNDYEPREVLGVAATLHDACLIGGAHADRYSDEVEPWATDHDGTFRLNLWGDGYEYVKVEPVPLCPTEVAQ